MRSDRRKPHNQGIQLHGINSEEQYSVNQQSIGSFTNRFDAPYFCASSLCVLSHAKSCLVCKSQRKYFATERGPLPCSISPSVSFSSELALSARWISMAGPSIPGFAILRPFGRWTTSVPVQIGLSEAVKSSVVYALDACDAHFGSNTDARSMLYSGPKAARALRLAWATADPANQEDIVSLIIAIQLNFSAEV